MNNEANSPKPPKLLDQVRTAIRLRRMSYRTEQTYCDWIKRFIFFHNKRHPAEITFHFSYSICHLLFVIEAEMRCRTTVNGRRLQT
ncbi:MAG: phage integrase N-terminal SAM-like domain-containing protein [Acidobacteria bacterium]|nr:phage integrase N-terminal SAM-like domain-containing protein [Acidobacteriota bacterium]